MTTDLAPVIRRNTLLLSTTSAVNSVVLQLAAAVSTLTFVLVTGHAGLLGLGPAIFLTSSGVTAVIAGRTMDRHGRRPVLVVGFVALASGCALNALATRTSSVPALLAGLVLIGVGMATSLLIRTAAGDMYTPERRARGISYVLFGSVFGAVLGPAVFSPMFAGKQVDPDVLTVPWLAAAAIALVAMAIVMLVRPDTREIAIQIGAEQGAPPPGAAAPLAEILRRPGVLPAMAASLASFSVMVSVMNLSGYVVVQVHHHAQDAVFPIIGAHVLGMYALVMVVGTLIDRIGRTPALAIGLLVMGASVLSLQWVQGVPATAVLLFGLGIGWNISFVAATAQLADLSSALERGKLLGFNDLIASLLGASMALVGGYGLETSGVGALAVGAAVVVVSPVAWILWREQLPAAVDSRRYRPLICRSVVDAFAAREHRHERRDSPGAGRRALGILDAVEDGVAVAAVERVEEGAGGGIAVELAGEVLGHLGGALRLIRGVPATVRAGALDLAQSGRLHLAALDQELGLGAVDLRPPAAASAGNEALHPVVGVERLLLAVDPAEADRHLQRLRVGDGLDAAALAGDLQPDALAPLRLAGEPLTPGLPAGERERRVGLLGHAGTVVAI